MSTDTNGTPSTEPLHITAAMALLATLRDTFHLPHPIAVRFEKSTGIGVVDVSTFGGTTVWADALGVPDRARLSTTQTNRSSTHSAWVKWNGWDLRVVAHVDAPDGCAGHTGADDCPNHVLRTSDAEPAPAGA